MKSGLDKANKGSDRSFIHLRVSNKRVGKRAEVRKWLRAVEGILEKEVIRMETELILYGSTTFPATPNASRPQY